MAKKTKAKTKAETKAKSKKEAKAKTKEPKSPKVSKAKLSKKLEGLISEIEKLSVLELADLVKALEDKFGVSAAPVAPLSGAPATAPATGEAQAEKPGAAKQTTFNVVLASAGANKISVIKAVREIDQTLGLKDAKDLVESAPKEILSGVNKSTAEEAKKKLEDVGASVELK